MYNADHDPLWWPQTGTATRNYSHIVQEVAFLHPSINSIVENHCVHIDGPKHAELKEKHYVVFVVNYSASGRGIVHSTKLFLIEVNLPFTYLGFSPFHLYWLTLSPTTWATAYRLKAICSEECALNIVTDMKCPWNKFYFS